MLRRRLGQQRIDIQLSPSCYSWLRSPFPVGCAYSDKIVFPEFFADNPDTRQPMYQTRSGIYEEGCGLDSVHMS